MIATAQIRAARAILHLSQKEIAAKAGVSIATYNNIERGIQNNPHLTTITSIQQAFEMMGVEFITQPLGGVWCLPEAGAR